MSKPLLECLSILYENGKPENAGRNHIPQVLLYIPNSPIRYHWLISELFHHRPNIGYALHSNVGRRPILFELNILPLYEMRVQGQEVKIATNFDGNQSLSSYLETCLDITYFNYRTKLQNGLPYLQDLQGTTLRKDSLILK